MALFPIEFGLCVPLWLHIDGKYRVYFKVISVKYVINNMPKYGTCIFIFLFDAGRKYSWLQIQRSRVRFPVLPDFLRSSDSETESTQPREDN
jgi:hypothetical protein